jgi:hypothetical protein
MNAKLIILDGPTVEVQICIRSCLKALATMLRKAAASDLWSQFPHLLEQPRSILTLNVIHAFALNGKHRGQSEYQQWQHFLDSAMTQNSVNASFPRVFNCKEGQELFTEAEVLILRETVGKALNRHTMGLPPFITQNVFFTNLFLPLVVALISGIAGAYFRKTGWKGGIVIGAIALIIAIVGFYFLFPPPFGSWVWLDSAALPASPSYLDPIRKEAGGFGDPLDGDGRTWVQLKRERADTQWQSRARKQRTPVPLTCSRSTVFTPLRPNSGRIIYLSACE